MKRLLCYVGMHHWMMRYMPNGRATGATHVVLVCKRCPRMKYGWAL